jgi:hypothetical protein
MHVNPGHPKQAQWMTCLVSMQVLEELGHFQLPVIVYKSLRHGPCIITLKHEGMAGDEGHDNGTQDLVTVSMCIQKAIDKMQLCSLSVSYACPYHKRTAIMGYFVHKVHISKPLAQTMPYMLPAICPVQLKRGLICEKHTSPACQ